jgi:hypothetical protein
MQLRQPNRHPRVLSLDEGGERGRPPEIAEDSPTLEDMLLRAEREAADPVRIWIQLDQRVARRAA